MTAPDLRRTLVYTDSKLTRLLLIMGFVMIALGVLFVSTSSPHQRHYMIGWLFGVLGVGFAIWGHFGLFRAGKALLTLSPQGLVLSSLGKDVFIPWRELRGIDTVSFRIWNPVFTALPPIFVPVRLKNVSVALISRDYYEGEIIPAFPMLAHLPVWGRTFRPRGDNLIEVCLHHDLLPATSEEIRKEVAARWYAFRDRDAQDRDTRKTEAAAPPAGTPPPAAASDAAKPVRFRIKWGKDS
jgi:hypothetical protein